MDNAARIYCFQLDDDDQVRWPQSFVGRHGSVVKGCHDLAAVLTFTTLAQANDFHMQSEASLRAVSCGCGAISLSGTIYRSLLHTFPNLTRGGAR